MILYYFEGVMKEKYPYLIGMFEKSKLKWFTLQEIKSARKQFRPFYRNIIDAIIADHK